MRRFPLLVLFCSCLLMLGWVGQVHAQTCQGIVVWRLETKTGVSDSDVDSLSGIIATEVERLSGLKVVSEADIRTILKGEEVKQRCSSEGDSSCVAEIGAALGVPEAVSGDLGKLGSIWVLNLRRINVRQAEVMKRVTRRIDGKIETLVNAVPDAIAELFNKSDGTTPSQSRPMSDLQTAGWALFGAGAGLVVLGGVGMWQMDAANSEDKSKFNAWKGVSAAGFALGGAALATGIGLLIADALSVPEKKDGATVSFGVAPQQDGMAAALVGRW